MNTRKSTYLLRLFVGIAVLGLAAGCSKKEHGDLVEYVNTIKARKPGRIPPVPEFKATDSFPYPVEHSRDPFTRAEKESIIPQDAVDNSGLAPDPLRNPEALEQFPLDSLKFLGHLEKSGDREAIILDPTGLVHRVSVGRYMGQNHGRIVSISETKIDLVEIVQSVLGGWVERDAAISLSD